MIKWVQIIAIAILTGVTCSALAHKVQGKPYSATLVSGDINETLELSFFLRDRVRSAARCHASFVIKASDATGSSRNHPIVEEISLLAGDFMTLDIPTFNGAVLVQARQVRIKGPCQLLQASRLKASTGETRARVVFSVRGFTDDGQ